MAFKFNQNICSSPNENHSLALTDLSTAIENKVNDYLSGFNLSSTVSVTDRIQTYSGYLYKFSFTVNDKSYNNAKFVKCIDDPVTNIYYTIIHRMSKLGIVNNTGTVQLYDTVSVDYTITEVIPSDEGYVVVMTVTYNGTNYNVTYLTNDVSKFNYDVREAILMALVNNLAISDFDVTVGYEYVEGS